MATPTPRLRHVMQHPGSKLCGQAVVAMAHGVPLSEGVKLMGHERSTRTRELVKALGNRTTATRLEAIRKRHIWDLPYVSVLRVRWHVGRDAGHYVLRDGPFIHDPLEAGPYPIATWEERIEPHGRVTSFLPLCIEPPLPQVGDEYHHPLHGRQKVVEIHDRGDRWAIVSESVERAPDGRPRVSVNTSVRKGQATVYKPVKSRYDVLGE